MMFLSGSKTGRNLLNSDRTVAGKDIKHLGYSL
jgi:hypothetical protein